MLWEVPTYVPKVQCSSQGVGLKSPCNREIVLYEYSVKCRSVVKYGGKLRRKCPGVQVLHRNTISNLVKKVTGSYMLIERNPKCRR
jgi:hypothetical protein